MADRIATYVDDPAVGPQDGRFWDCECELDYIHLHDAHYCYKCEAYAEDAPDSRVNEILNYIADDGRGRSNLKTYLLGDSGHDAITAVMASIITSGR